MVKLFLLVLAVITVFFLLTKIPKTTEYRPPLSLNENKLWNIIQKWRSSENLEQYIKDERLCRISEKRAEEIVFDYTHDKFVERYTNSSYSLSENFGTATSEQYMLNAWLYSPEHAAALRYPYKYSCVSCQDLYCVQIFSNF